MHMCYLLLVFRTKTTLDNHVMYLASTMNLALRSSLMALLNASSFSGCCFLLLCAMYGILNQKANMLKATFGLRHVISFVNHADSS